jgi:hypothetical protein
MRDTENYNLFISHGWYYNYDYENLTRLLNSDPDFNWRNYSVPETDFLILIKLCGENSVLMIEKIRVFLLCSPTNDSSSWIYGTSQL